MIRYLPLLLILLLGASPQDSFRKKPKKQGLTNEQRVKAKEIIKRYFKEQDKAAREKILAELEPMDVCSKSDISYFRRYAFSWARYGTRHNGKSPGVCGKGKYIINGHTSARRRR